MQKAVLIINIGSPAHPTPEAVGDYLNEFLMDPFVIHLPLILRYPLVRWLITPRRKQLSAKLYKLIWSPTGSPLIQHSMDLAFAIQKELGDEFVVMPAMRYGTPSISDAMTLLKRRQVSDVTAIPLYPQYSLSATESAVEEIKREATGMDVNWVRPFFQNENFLTAFTNRTRKTIIDFKPDKILFSFHGLPRRHITQLHWQCRFNSCCDQLETHEKCYRAQAFYTARAIAQRLQLPETQYEVAFQSRLTDKWIQPFTDARYQQLPREGVRRLAVVCPSFVADCLETLEEVQIRGEKLFRESGGEALRLVPSLNAEPDWVKAVCGMISEAQPL